MTLEEQVSSTIPPKILVVVDEPNSLRLTGRVLERAGYHVITAATGEDGLRRVRREKPTLVLLDVLLPDINSTEVCRRIKADASLADICVVLISASETASERQAEGLEAGADGYIARPVSNRELLARVEAMLRLKQAEHDLRRYETILSAVVDPISYVDRDYVYRAVNDAYASYAKRPRKEIVGLTVAELIGKEAFEEHVKPHLDRCFTGEQVHYQAWFDVPGEDPKYMDVSYSPVFSEDGSVIGAAVNSRDITERKQIEERLQRERDLVARIMETSPIGIVVLDQQGRISFANAQIEKLTGLTREQIVQSAYDDPRWRVLDQSGQNLPKEMYPFAQAMHNGHPAYEQEHIIELPEDRRLLLSINSAPLLDDAGEPSSVVMAIEDVTERRRTEQALRESREFFQSALDALSANIAVLDEDGQIIAVNASWCQFGDENDLAWADCGVGRNYLQVLDAASGEPTGGAQGAAQGIRDVLAGRLDRYWQEYPCHSPWEQRWYAMWVTRFESSEGPRAVIAHENVTERKLAELELREAKNAAEGAQQEAEAARQEEERRREIAEGLRDIVSILNSNHPLRQVLDHIVIQARQLLGSQAVAIYRLEEGPGHLTLRAAQGLPDGCPLRGENAASLTILRQAVSGSRPIATPGRTTPDFGDVHEAYTTCSDMCQALLAVPISIKDSVYGGMLLCNTEPRTFCDDDVELAVVFADQVALAIENARLRDQVEQAAIAAERSRLARDLHDAVTQTLFSASLIAESLPRIWQRYPEETERGLQELRQLTRGALAEMRTLLLELRPAALTEKPLGELLRNLTDATNSRTRVPITLNAREDGSLPANVQVVIYRLAQEALNNIAKHAKASSVTVDLECQSARVALDIRDDGCGFDLGAIPAGHLGIGIMRERADAIGAELQISSHPGQGTEIVVRWQEQGRETYGSR
jgi:PAS domain S-box-containing protein